MRIRYYGHAHMQTGYGRAALDLILALDRAGAQVQIRTVGQGDHTWMTDSGVYGDMFQVIDDPDVVIVHTMPGDCHRVLELEGLQRSCGSHQGPKLVAYTTWEALTAPPEVLQPLVESFDQVWVPSTAAAAALATALPRTSAHSEPEILKVVPHCYDDELDRPPEQYLDPGKFRFYWIGAWSARKNPAGLIRAFAHAFQPGQAVELVLHSPGCSIDTFVATLASTGLEQDDLPPIVVSTQHLSADALAKLHRESDCFVSAARGEAWNLPAFDALLTGRHVITQYGLGSDEFLSDTSADLVDGWEAPAQVDVAHVASSGGELRLKTIGAQGLTSRSLWLEPNLSSLAEAMRAAFAARKRNIKIDYDVSARFGYEAVAKQVLHVLEQS
jgi:glycosyltransferase involved in cell wall biosynthesis